MSKVYVITGGAGGMGKAIARRFSQKGTLLLADVRAEKLEEVAAELQPQAVSKIRHMTVDITDEKQVKELADAASQLGELGAIIHTGGLSPTMADVKKILEVNSIGTGHILKAFLPLAQQGSVAACIASMGGHFTPRNPAYNSILKQPLAFDFLSKMAPYVQDNPGAAYGLSKLGVMLMVEDQAWDWGQKEARIVSVSPGTINTAMGRLENENQPEMGRLLDITPLGREGDADEIAAAVEFLCSDESSYITGTDLRVDGGTIANSKRLNQQNS